MVTKAKKDKKSKKSKWRLFGVWREARKPRAIAK
jgi:hypothetical protein